MRVNNGSGWILCAIMIFCGATEAPSSDVPRDGKVTGRLRELFGGEEGVDVARRATEATAFRLVNASYFKPTLKEYKVVGDPITLKRKIFQPLGVALTSDSAYSWKVLKPCEPNFGARIQFVKGKDQVDVLFCFGCDILAVYHNGKHVGDEDFDVSRARYVGIMKKIFPDDPVIQSLKPKE
ncbi:MAG: hypothetical protein N2C14_13755 [Planctomycetales bacterium]